MPDSFDEWIDNVCDSAPLPSDLDIDDDDDGPVGPPLATGEIQAASTRLARWQSATAFSS